MADEVSAIDASARELAQRHSGEIEVFLFWHPALDRIELCVLDSTTGVSVHVDVTPDRALDAFYHPYAYMAQPKRASLPGSIESTSTASPTAWE